MPTFTDRAVSHLHEYIDRFFARLSDEAPENLCHFNREKEERGEYRYISLTPYRFLDLMATVEKTLAKGLVNYSFVDAGCGVGHKLLLAKCCGFSHISGIDISREYLDKAKEILPQFQEYGARPFKLINRDIREIDYKGYDVIYFYVPIRHEEKEKEFEKRVVETASSGAIIVGVSNNSLQTYEELEPVEEGHHIIYRKK